MLYFWIAGASRMSEIVCPNVWFRNTGIKTHKYSYIQSTFHNPVPEGRTDTLQCITSTDVYVFPKSWQILSITNIYIYIKIIPPILRPKGEQKPSNWHMSPKCWQNISNINIYIQLTNILTLFPAYIQCKCKCQFPNPTPEVPQKPFNWHISPNCCQNISIYNINLYIQLTNVPAYMYNILFVYAFHYLHIFHVLHVDTWEYNFWCPRTSEGPHIPLFIISCILIAHLTFSIIFAGCSKFYNIF